MKIYGKKRYLYVLSKLFIYHKGFRVYYNYVEEYFLDNTINVYFEDISHGICLLDQLKKNQINFQDLLNINFTTTFVDYISIIKLLHLYFHIEIDLDDNDFIFEQAYFYYLTKQKFIFTNDENNDWGVNRMYQEKYHNNSYLIDRFIEYGKKTNNNYIYIFYQLLIKHKEYLLPLYNY